MLNRPGVALRSGLYSLASALWQKLPNDFFFKTNTIELFFCLLNNKVVFRLFCKMHYFHTLDTIRFNMHPSLYTGLILLDLQKAFDTFGHRISLKKLEGVGANNGVNWFKSYAIQRRKQAVHVHGCQSTPKNITSGVPQGSILGTQLFVIYVNGMVNATSFDCIFMQMTQHC